MNTTDIYRHLKVYREIERKPQLKGHQENHDFVQSGVCCDTSDNLNGKNPNPKLIYVLDFGKK